MFSGTALAVVGSIGVIVLLTVIFPTAMIGLVIIREQQVGVVIKRFSVFGKSLPPDRQVALNGEAGYQADTLAPGWYFGYWIWMYSVKRVNAIIIPQGEIALVVAADGQIHSIGADFSADCRL